MKHRFCVLFFAAFASAATLPADESPASAKPVLLQKYGQMAIFIKMEGSVVFLQMQGRTISEDIAKFPAKDQALLKTLAAGARKEIPSEGVHLEAAVADFVVGSDQNVYGVTQSKGSAKKGFFFKADPDLSNVTEIYAVTNDGSEPRVVSQGKDGKIYAGGVGPHGSLLVYDPATATAKTSGYLPASKPAEIDPKDWEACQPVLDFCVMADGTIYGLGKEVLFQSRLDAPGEFKVFATGWKAFVDGGDGFLYGATTDGMMRFKTDTQEWSLVHQLEKDHEMVGRPLLLPNGPLVVLMRKADPGGEHFDALCKSARDGSDFNEVTSITIAAEAMHEQQFLQNRASTVRVEQVTQSATPQNTVTPEPVPQQIPAPQQYTAPPNAQQQMLTQQYAAQIAMQQQYAAQQIAVLENNLRFAQQNPQQNAFLIAQLNAQLRALRAAVQQDPQQYAAQQVAAQQSVMRQYLSQQIAAVQTALQNAQQNPQQNAYVIPQLTAQLNALQSAQLQQGATYPGGGAPGALPRNPMPQSPPPAPPKPDPVPAPPNPEPREVVANKPSQSQDDWPLPKGALAYQDDLIYACGQARILVIPAGGKGYQNEAIVASFDEAKDVEKMAIRGETAYLLDGSGHLAHRPLDASFFANRRKAVLAVQSERDAKEAMQKENAARTEQQMQQAKEERDLADSRRKARLEQQKDEEAQANSKLMKPYGPRTKHDIQIQTVGSQQAITIDGHQGPSYREIFNSRHNRMNFVLSPAISADDEQVVYLARNQNNKFVVVNNGIEGPEFGSIEYLMFAPSGHRLVYVGRQGTGRDRRVGDFVLVDGVKEYPIGGWSPQQTRDGEVKPGVAFSPDGNRLAYVRYYEGGQRLLTGTVVANVVVDGRPQKQVAYQVNDLLWSADSSRFACILDNRRQISGITLSTVQVVVDGVADPAEYEQIQHLQFAPQGSHYVYSASELTIRAGTSARIAESAAVEDGREIARLPALASGMPSVTEIAISSDGTRVAYVAARMENGEFTSYVYENGKRGLGYRSCRNLQYMPDSTDLSYIATSGINNQAFRVVNGREFSIK